MLDGKIAALTIGTLSGGSNRPGATIVAVSGGAYSGEYIAFALPEEIRPTGQQ